MASTAAVDDQAVLIVGSGCTGLALAQGLRKASIPAVVFERDASLNARPRDWNMGLHWGAPSLRALMGEEAWSRIQSVQVDPNEPTKFQDRLQFLQGDTGEAMSGATVDYFYRLRRSKLRELLSESLDIRFNKRMSSITFSESADRVTAHFDDGTSTTGRILIGADGAHSAVRRSVVDKTSDSAHLTNRLPICATFLQARFTREQALFLRSFHPLYLAAIHPKNYFAFFGMQDATDASAPETWTFFFYVSWRSPLAEQDATASWTDRQRLDQARNLVREAGFCDPWKSAYEWVSDDAKVWYMSMTDWDPDETAHAWDNHGGLCTLAGDAAHTMTYQRGQGLNHSITDAARLLSAIQSFWPAGDAPKDQKDAIDEYENEMIARSGEEVRKSTQNTLFLHDWEKVMHSPLMKQGMLKN